MALSDFTELNIDSNSCYGPENVLQNLTSLNALYEEAQKPEITVSCQTYEETFNIENNGPQECRIVIPARFSTDENFRNAKTKKLFAFTVDAFWGIPAEQIVILDYQKFLNLDLYCGDAPIISALNPEGGRLTTFECDPREDVVLCVSASTTTPQYTVPNLTVEDLESQFAGTVSVRVCLSVICFDQNNRDVSRIYIPCELDTSCCYGSEALGLVVNNINQLNSIFNDFGVVSTTGSPEWNDGDPHTLIPATPGPGVFFVRGVISICIRNPKPIDPGFYTLTPSDTDAFGFQSTQLVNDGVRYTVVPQVACGDNIIRCSKKTELILNEQKTTIQIPVIACGTCDGQERLAVSFYDDRRTCENDGYLNGSPEEFVLEIESVNQAWCWTYWYRRTTATPNPPISYQYGCLDNDLADRIKATANAINTRICELEEPGCTRIETQSNFNAIGADHQIVGVSQPPPPPEPIPVPTWYVGGEIRFCIDTSIDPSILGSSVNEWFIGYDIKCGGQIRYTVENINWFNTAASLRSNPCFEVPVIACVPCIITEPLLLCPFIRDATTTIVPYTQFGITWSTTLAATNL